MSRPMSDAVPGLTLDPARSLLLVVDVQARLMPAIDDAPAVIGNVRRLMAAAGLVDVPVLVTEQNAGGLGPTVPELAAGGHRVVHKATFDACLAPGFLDAVPEGRDLVVAGCEAHVCVLQSVLGLIARGRRVFVVRDALGARRAESKETALARMARHGAEMLTTEMAVFEWIGSARHPRFREAIALVK